MARYWISFSHLINGVKRNPLQIETGQSKAVTGVHILTAGVTNAFHRRLCLWDYVAKESDLLFFNKDKYQAGISHAEYAQYWRQNLQLMPKIALRLSAGMLPSEFFQFTSDPVVLHDSKIQNVTVIESLLTMRLHGDDSGGLRIIDIQYDCNGLTIPDIPSSLLENNPDCELMCHEFLRQDHCYEHRMLFANGIELRVQFNLIMANVTPDQDKTE